MNFTADQVLTLGEIRQGKGIPQKDMAKILGISQQFYCDIEAGRRNPNIETLHKIACFFGTSMDFIYHSLKKQRVVWHFPDAYLEYGMRAAMEHDAEYLRAHYPPPGSPASDPAAKS